MASCLGIHISGKILKFAKINLNDDKKSPKISVEKYGVKFVLGNKLDLIKNVITETDSQNIPVVISSYDDYYLKAQVFKQLSKADAHNVINLEFDDWCARNAKESQKYLYTYLMPEVSIGDYYTTVINISEKEAVDLYKDTRNINVASMYTTPFTFTSLVDKDEKNYVLVNLDDRLYMTTVIDGKIIEFNFEDIGMKDILDKFTELVGSEQKAYESCKSINVFAEGESTNQKDLELIVESILQDILKKVAEVVNRRKTSINKVLITGMGTLFTNIDILFREFLDIKTEILKPSFLASNENVKNIAEELEAVPAMSIAYQYLNPTIQNVSYFKKSSIAIFEFIQKLFRKNENEKNIKKKNADDIAIASGFDVSKLTPIMISISIVLGLVLLTYLIFSNIYVTQIAKIRNEIDEKASSISQTTAKVSSDISYINSNTSQYKSINDDVQKTVDLINTKQIGSSTYNVAAFMQKIIKIIPKNVQLKTISSDDNKKIKINAQSDSYAALGYFVAQLKIQNVLNNVTINSITNSTTIVIEIGGELP